VPTANSKRGIRRTITGRVSSAKPDKTVIVTVMRRFRDKQFHKFINRRVKFHAHDENNSAHEGDLVELVESRPYSKLKRWRVSNIIEKARQEEVGE
jgi:small subunit ribosomal protein S17